MPENLENITGICPVFPDISFSYTSQNLGQSGFPSELCPHAGLDSDYEVTCKHQACMECPVSLNPQIILSPEEVQSRDLVLERIETAYHLSLSVPRGIVGLAEFRLLAGEADGHWLAKVYSAGSPYCDHFEYFPEGIIAVTSHKDRLPQRLEEKAKELSQSLATKLKIPLYFKNT